MTHHDIMVDIEKMVLAGPCNPTFSLSTSLFVVNTHTIIKTSLFWHIYGSDTFFKIVDNLTLKTNSAAGIIEFDWQPSWILTDLLKIKLFPKYFIKIHHPKTYV